MGLISNPTRLVLISSSPPSSSFLQSPLRNPWLRMRNRNLKDLVPPLQVGVLSQSCNYAQRHYGCRISPYLISTYNLECFPNTLLGMKLDTIRSESAIIRPFPFNSEKKRGGVAVLRDANTWFERQQQEKEMLKIQAENKSAMETAEELHRKKLAQDQQGEMEEDIDIKDDPMARAEAEALSHDND